MTHTDPLAPAQHSAHEWLSAIANRLGTDDHRYTYRSLRAWLHLVRDRLTVDAAAHLAAQLPELLRGTFFDGWKPSRVPIRYDADEFIHRFAAEAGIGSAEVPMTASAISESLRELFSPGQLDHALTLLPKHLRDALTDAGAPAPVQDKSAERRLSAQVHQLKGELGLLADAIATLARGLEEIPTDEPGNRRGAEAARAVHRILLAREAS
ncbi:DUF2267 domain-containing protein [Amycolatopsis anabasis]|uniref:DUF2267 domain-containing protein n=1 Tax=Amycolatopsis anabasis TaxID=1840409 RepID=UPI00131E32FF|nr:DUF2267 domain-containing protein [Amycolatopsis anabasis]